MRHWIVVCGSLGALLGLGCDSLSEARGVCRCPPARNAAAIELGCVPLAPPVVKTTGPCEACPAALPNGMIPEGSHCAVQPNQDNIQLLSHGAGICHVEVTFGDGTTSGVDVDFVSKWQACGSDPRGCGEAFFPITPDGSDRLSLSAPRCATGLDAGS